MTRDQFEVKQIDDAKFGLFLDGNLIGTAKSRSDCDFAREVILRAANQENRAN